ncbi:MAG: DUF4093 domain-containing protein [Clostridiales bacterium]|nr:DUF4093 domain-containing protein [Clostridiales bacterium]
MIHLEQAIIVEGKYDKIKLSSIIDAVIIPTNGYGIFKDKKKIELIRMFARTKGIIILTDSDSAGFLIRSHIKSIIPEGEVMNVYIPDIFGKERRKAHPSAEGKLGVEGIPTQKLLDAFKKAGVLPNEKKEKGKKITKVDLYNDGLTGRENSAKMRELLLKELSLPSLMTTNSMLEIMNSMMSYDEYRDLIQGLKAAIPD